MASYQLENILFHNFHHFSSDKNEILIRMQDGLFSKDATAFLLNKFSACIEGYNTDQVRDYNTPHPLHIYSPEFPNYTSINGVPLSDGALVGDSAYSFPSLTDNTVPRKGYLGYSFPLTPYGKEYYSHTTDGQVQYGGVACPDTFITNILKHEQNSLDGLYDLRHFTQELSTAYINKFLYSEVPSVYRNESLKVAGKRSKSWIKRCYKVDNLINLYETSLATYDIYLNRSSNIPKRDIKTTSISLLSVYDNTLTAFDYGIPVILCPLLSNSDVGTIRALASAAEKSLYDSREYTFLYKIVFQGYSMLRNSEEVVALYNNYYLDEHNPHKHIGGGYLGLQLNSMGHLEIKWESSTPGYRWRGGN